MSFTLKGLLLTTCLAVIILMTSKTAVAKPTDGYKQNSYLSSFCDKNETKLYVCQKCAKITKSADVYPDCCMEREDVYRWCFKYVQFGLNE